MQAMSETEKLEYITESIATQEFRDGHTDAQLHSMGTIVKNAYAAVKQAHADGRISDDQLKQARSRQASAHCYIHNEIGHRSVASSVDNLVIDVQFGETTVGSPVAATISDSTYSELSQAANIVELGSYSPPTQVSRSRGVLTTLVAAATLVVAVSVSYIGGIGSALAAPSGRISQEHQRPGWVNRTVKEGHLDREEGVYTVGDGDGWKTVVDALCPNLEAKAKERLSERLQAEHSATHSDRGKYSLWQGDTFPTPEECVATDAKKGAEPNPEPTTTAVVIPEPVSTTQGEMCVSAQVSFSVADASASFSAQLCLPGSGHPESTENHSLAGDVYTIPHGEGWQAIIDDACGPGIDTYAIAGRMLQENFRGGPTHMGVAAGHEFLTRDFGVPQSGGKLPRAELCDPKNPWMRKKKAAPSDSSSSDTGDLYEVQPGEGWQAIIDKACGPGINTYAIAGRMPQELFSGGPKRMSVASGHEFLTRDFGVPRPGGKLPKAKLCDPRKLWMKQKKPVRTGRGR